MPRISIFRSEYYRLYVCTEGDGGESATVPFIVFEYMSLGDLAALLRKSDPVVFRAPRSPDTEVIIRPPSRVQSTPQSRHSGHRSTQSCSEHPAVQTLRSSDHPVVFRAPRSPDTEVIIRPSRVQSTPQSRH